ncbi:hypothetical protein K1T71_007553 [Dendrolimus kikuchii]|uniref:Uncharacterized protein n=1 Tax=Dendrolimus kikuchii TaxID=765133 RepID=A0ACC1CXD6_9NEOP|nr:hypothetical protein K1T71_007553 [Dendrolimus kikuchii]
MKASKPKSCDRKIQKINYKAIATELHEADWSKCLNAHDVNVAVDDFYNILFPVIDRHTTTKCISRSQFVLKPWITPGLVRCMKHRDKLHLDHKKDPNDIVRKSTYHRYKNFCNNLLRKLKRDYEKNQLENNKQNPKKLWKSIQAVIGNHSKHSPATELLNNNSSSSELINNCNEYFSTIGSQLADKLLKKLNKTERQLARNLNNKLFTSPVQSFFMTPTDEVEVGKLIDNLKIDSAPGLDGIRTAVIRETKREILSPLCHIFNVSLATGIFPSYWKQANLIPIYKNGLKNTPENYRPISLLPIFSKILEKIVNSRLSKYMETFNIISNIQFGFRQNKSTEDAVELLSRRVVENLDMGRKTIGVFLDLAKAFDTVSVPTLWETAKHKTEVGMMAIKEWLDNNLLTLNLNKTKYLCFHKTKASEPKIDLHIKIHSLCNFNTCNCESISQTTSIRYLGVEVDDNFTFQNHIKNLSKRVRKLIYIMRSLRACVNNRILRLVYTSLCESIITYCITSWGGAGITLMIDLERAQRSVLKVMMKKPFRYCTSKLYTEAEVLSVRQLYIQKVTLKIHRLSQDIKPNSENKRRGINIPIPQVKTSFAQRFPAFRYPFIYNSIAKLSKGEIIRLTLKQAKTFTFKLLHSLSYFQTEELLRIVS